MKMAGKMILLFTADILARTAMGSNLVCWKIFRAVTLRLAEGLPSFLQPSLNSRFAIPRGDGNDRRENRVRGWPWNPPSGWRAADARRVGGCMCSPLTPSDPKADKQHRHVALQRQIDAEPDVAHDITDVL